MGHDRRTSPAKIAERLRSKFGADIDVSEKAGSLVLEGNSSSWETKIAVGWDAARFGYHGVVNDIKAAGVEDAVLSPPAVSDGLIDGLSCDVAVIGGGVIGAAIARELSRRAISIVLLEKEYDVAVHTSSRNDGMIHDGFAAAPGTKKAALNVRGNRLWEPLCHDLGINFKRPGSLILFKEPSAVLAYPFMAARAKKNDVDGWEYWSRRRVAAEEPNVTDDQHGGFFLPSAGALSPYRATVALAENATANGVRIVLDACVLGMEKEGTVITALRTNRGTLRAGVVVNAAGNWADVVAGMAGDRFFSLHQRRGSALILDLATGRTQRHILGMPSLSQTKTRTKGGGLVTTVEGNILVGPTAREEAGREDYRTEAAEIDELEKHLRLNTKLSLSQVITYFTGVRACTYEEDFIVEKSSRVPNLVHAAGIQSPGLASAPAIAEDVSRMVCGILSPSNPMKPRAGWNGTRVAPRELRRLDFEERAKIIARNPQYGRIVCRCEEISEGEIRDALRSPLPVVSMDAVKRRTRAGMGRCHGGFCTPRVMEIIASEKGIHLDMIEKKGTGSRLCIGETKTDLSVVPEGSPF